jgi:hypothetical protein
MNRVIQILSIIFPLILGTVSVLAIISLVLASREYDLTESLFSYIGFLVLSLLFLGYSLFSLKHIIRKILSSKNHKD